MKGFCENEYLFAECAGSPRVSAKPDMRMNRIWRLRGTRQSSNSTNNSGPLIFEVGFLMLLMATGYARSRRVPAQVAVS